MRSYDTGRGEGDTPPLTRDVADRLIVHLDKHFARRVEHVDVADWREIQWRRTFTRAGASWNPRDPWPAIELVLEALAARGAS